MCSQVDWIGSGELLFLLTGRPRPAGRCPCGLGHMLLGLGPHLVCGCSPVRVTGTGPQCIGREAAVGPWPGVPVAGELV